MKYFAVLFAALLSGCVSVNYDAKNVKPESNEGIFIAGVEAHNMPFLGALNGNYSPHVQLTKVKLKNGAYDQSFLQSSYSYDASIKSGYAVMSLAETKDDEAYVLTSYKGNPASTFIFSFNCTGRQSPVFRIKAGQVLYLGNFSLGPFIKTYDKISWQLERTSDIEGAKGFLQKNHPELEQKLVPHEQLLATTRLPAANCSN